MPSSELPPKSPEMVVRRLAIGLLAYLSVFQRTKKDSDVLLFAPILPKGEEARRKITGFSPADTSEMYKALKGCLFSDLEESNDSLFNILLQRYKTKTGMMEVPHWMVMLLSLLETQPDDFLDVIAEQSENIHDEGFSAAFGYNMVVRGMNKEVLTLAHATENGLGEKPALHLGMNVRYRKKLSPPTGKHPLAKRKRQAPGTGPLEGEGKIIQISIPQIGSVPDQAITLLVKGEKLDTRTHLSLDEIVLD